MSIKVLSQAKPLAAKPLAAKPYPLPARQKPLKSSLKGFLSQQNSIELCPQAAQDKVTFVMDNQSVLGKSYKISIAKSADNLEEKDYKQIAKIINTLERVAPDFDSVRLYQNGQLEITGEDTHEHRWHTPLQVREGQKEQMPAIILKHYFDKLNLNFRERSYYPARIEDRKANCVLEIHNHIAAPSKEQQGLLHALGKATWNFLGLSKRLDRMVEAKIEKAKKAYPDIDADKLREKLSALRDSKKQEFWRLRVPVIAASETMSLAIYLSVFASIGFLAPPAILGIAITSLIIGAARVFLTYKKIEYSLDVATNSFCQKTSSHPEKPIEHISSPYIFTCQIRWLEDALFKHRTDQYVKKAIKELQELGLPSKVIEEKKEELLQFATEKYQEYRLRSGAEMVLHTAGFTAIGLITGLTGVVDPIRVAILPLNWLVSNMVTLFYNYKKTKFAIAGKKGQILHELEGFLDPSEDAALASTAYFDASHKENDIVARHMEGAKRIKKIEIKKRRRWHLLLPFFSHSMTAISIAALGIASPEALGGLAGKLILDAAVNRFVDSRKSAQAALGVLTSYRKRQRRLAIERQAANQIWRMPTGVLT